MKKLAKTLILALLFVPMLISCESLTGDVENISTLQPDITTLEDGGEAPLGGKPV